MIETSTIATWKLTPVPVLALSSAGVFAGQWLKRKLPVLDRIDLPAPIVGGMIYALAALVLRDRVVNLDADTTLRDLLMIAFMTTIGLSASLQMIKSSSRAVVLLLAAASGGAILQNVVGMAIAHAMGQDARLGLMAGSVALAGGPATAIAFGTTFEKLGVHGATALGMAAATFGIAVAGLSGGYVGGWLIRRHKDLCINKRFTL
jgi:ESS family glutamate:Na+ symporter